jgi:hypothetical protein
MSGWANDLKTTGVIGYFSGSGVMVAPQLYQMFLLMPQIIQTTKDIVRIP